MLGESSLKNSALPSYLRRDGLVGERSPGAKKSCDQLQDSRRGILRTTETEVHAFRYSTYSVSVSSTLVFWKNASQEFLLVRPTQSNLELYEDWIRSPTQSQVFFGDLADICYRCVCVFAYVGVCIEHCLLK